MIKHIVMWKLKEQAEGKTKAENRKEAVTRLMELKKHIPQIKELEVGENFNPAEAAYDLALYSVFETKEDLQTYQDHPEHVKVAQYINCIREERAVVDYET